MKRTLAGRAADTYVLASAEKVGAVSPYSVLPLGDVTAVISDTAGDDPVVLELRRAGVRVIAAGDE